MRNFGLSSRPALGANTQGGPLSRVAVSREPVLESSSTAERGVLSAMVAGSNPASPAKFQLAGKTSRPANSRGANPEFLITMERAAKWFCIGFFGAIGFGVFVCCIALSQLIYWPGVWESLGLR